MDKFKIEYYTDPLCCWSWAMEPQMRKLRFLLKEQLELQYVMGGLLKDWEHFSDKLNDINRPSQFGPLWMEAKHISGQPIVDHIWLKNPVQSSYPACMAVKAAEAQSQMAGEAMLRELREAVMMQQKNIGEMDILLEIAADLDSKNILDLKDFRNCFFSPEAAQLFQEDINQIKIKEITRFPSLLITYGGRTVQITGYRPFSALKETFKLLDPNLELEESIDEDEYLNSWENLTKREFQEVKRNTGKKETAAGI